MNKALRKTGVDIIGEVSWGTHLCLFYQTKSDLLEILVPFSGRVWKTTNSAYGLFLNLLTWEKP